MLIEKQPQELQVLEGHDGSNAVLAVKEIDLILTSDPLACIRGVADTLMSGIGVAAQLARDPGNAMSATVRAIQGAHKYGLFRSLVGEFERLCEEGGFDPGILNRAEFATSIADLLEILDSEAIDPKRFECVKKVFLAGTLGADLGDEIIRRKMLKIAGQLSADEITLFTALYKKDGLVPSDGKEVLGGEAQDFPRVPFLELLVDITGLGFPEYAEDALTRLSEKRLISAWSSSGRDLTFRPHIKSGIGERFYRFMTYFEIE